jgi:hypothetical protein
MDVTLIVELDNDVLMILEENLNTVNCLGLELQPLIYGSFE